MSVSFLKPLFALVSSFVASATFAAERPLSPPWLQDLVIYEIATKAYTSPNGPESGTFESLKAKLPYLQDLGITGIWLTGHSLSDPHHFYNIWTQYALIEPDKLDPSLGTETQFKSLVDEAHRRGIKVFLDVINHGVMAGSSLIKQHPEWFLGGSWGMIDYDWDGGHTDLDDWWVSIWLRAVTEWGTDGFRLDTNTPRPDLWARIKRNAAAAGHPIVIFEEFNRIIPGVTEFTQHDNYIGRELSDEIPPLLAEDIPGYYARKFGRAGRYTVEVEYSDGSRARGSTERAAGEALSIQPKGLTADKTRIDKVWPDGLPDLQINIAGVESAKTICNVIVTSNLISHLREGTWSLSGREGGILAMEGQGPTRQLYLSTLSYGSSIMLSSHDNGWTNPVGETPGFPLNANPYVAKGSRALFGYSLLFTPMLPIFMSGEEFDARYHALPTLSTDLYGHENHGQGRWLYGAQLDWSELERTPDREMLDDVKRTLAIRRQEWTVLAPETRGEVEPQLVAVPFTSDIPVPTPYVRWKDGVGIVILANRDTQKDAHITLEIPLDKVDPAASAKYVVTDLWNDRQPNTYASSDLADLAITVKRDKTRRGGPGVVKIEPVK